MKKMNLHKKFIDELGKRREAVVADIVGDFGIVFLKNNNIQNLNDNLDQLEQIFYTVDYLIKNELVERKQSAAFSIPDFNPMNFFKDRKKEDYRVSRIHAMPEYLCRYWNINLLVKPIFFKMIQNGYKTDEEKKEKVNFWLPICLVILSSFLTGFFTSLFGK